MTSLTFTDESRLRYIPLHNGQAQPRRVSGVGWSDWLAVISPHPIAGTRPMM